MCVRNGDGVDFGVTTGEQFQHFAYWAVSRHPEGQFADHDVMELLRNEFPFRNDERKWPNAKRRTFQSISAYRSYARDGRKLGIRNEAERAEVLSRIDAKMRVMPKNRSVAGQLPKEEERDERDLALGRSHPVIVVSSANVEKILADKPWLEDHPHMHDLGEWRFENAIYVAREWLSCEPEHGGDERVPGAGTFAFDRDLVLTAPSEQFRGGHFYYWSLFPWCGELRNARFSRILSPEYLVDETTLNTHTGYGQELVIDQCDYPDAIRWALGLVRRFGQPAGGR